MMPTGSEARGDAGAWDGGPVVDRPGLEHARPGAGASASLERGHADADGWIILLAGGLLSFGVVIVYSASMSLSAAPLDPGRWWDSPLRQAAFALLGLMAMLLTAGVDHRTWSWRGRWGAVRAGGPALLAALLLAAVLVPGVGSAARGARRTLAIPFGSAGIGFQPAELAKVALVLWLAALLTRPGFDVRRLRGGFAPAIGSAALLIGLTGLEDFGTAALMGVITIAMLVLGGARWLHVAGVGVLGAAAGAGLIALKPYRWQRIAAFFTENPDPAREGYQITQSLIAIGSGGWLGRGLGNGVQKFDYVPHDENDFIFSITCEELGVVGGLAVILVFLAFLWRGFVVARRCADPFGRLLATGLSLLICLQAAFNVAVATNSVPTKGISLPFVSAGGSGALFLSIAAGLIAAVGRGGAAEPAGGARL